MDVYDRLAPPDTTNTITTANNFVATKRRKNIYEMTCCLYNNSPINLQMNSQNWQTTNDLLLVHTYEFDDAWVIIDILCTPNKGNCI